MCVCVLAEGEGRRRDKGISKVLRRLDAEICKVLCVVLSRRHAQSPSVNHSVKRATWPHTISWRAGWSPSLGHRAANTAAAKRFLVEPSPSYYMAVKYKMAS